jgi:fructose-bisphosphate aldolase class I
MTTTDLDLIAHSLVANGKGILAADETPCTMTTRFNEVGIACTADSRRAYRELLFTTPGIAEFISGVILQDETIRQRSSAGIPLPARLAEQGIIPGISVDDGAKPRACTAGERITDRLHALPQRLHEYYAMGARFAKCGAVMAIGEGRPSTDVRARAHALARYAAICQAHGLVPIVEAEVLMDGAHSLDRCADVTAHVLHTVFDELFSQRVRLEGMLLKPNMVIAGAACPTPAPPMAVASATVRCLRRHAPAAVPGIVFLSGGQDHFSATLHLSLINQQPEPKPWTLTFSYARALQDEALTVWRGIDANVAAAQGAFYNRARYNLAAAHGRYIAAMEAGPAAA